MSAGLDNRQFSPPYEKIKPAYMSVSFEKKEEDWKRQRKENTMKIRGMEKRLCIGRNHHDDAISEPSISLRNSPSRGGGGGGGGVLGPNKKEFKKDTDAYLEVVKRKKEGEEKAMEDRLQQRRKKRELENKSFSGSETEIAEITKAEYRAERAERKKKSMDCMISTHNPQNGRDATLLFGPLPTKNKACALTGGDSATNPGTTKNKNPGSTKQANPSPRVSKKDIAFDGEVRLQISRLQDSLKGSTATGLLMDRKFKPETEAFQKPLP